ncbi:MAG: amidohydrolase family protein [Steroidobacteraceae bacterium]|jgi:predicted TIM-barrel fold metal-dependent hydrolase|nr:amidohydrolase family protein [Steroidobacteraceae bacterium]
MSLPPFVDAHHHLWDLGALHYPWLMARGVRRFFGDPTPIQRDYRVHDLLADAAGLPLAKSVHVQVGVADTDVVAETRWLQRCADEPAGPGLPHAIVAYCDLASPAAMEVVAAHRQSANLRGIRQILGRRDDEDRATGSDRLVDEPRFAEHLAALSALDLAFDLQLVPRQMLRVARLLERVPGLRVALCHCGSPWERSREGLAAWRDGLQALAALPHVHCKLSGFGMFDPDWTDASIAPLLEACIEAFGARRCMFGSNFPVEKLARPYHALYAAYDRLTTGLGSEQRQALFAGTAEAFYRI